MTWRRCRRRLAEKQLRWEEKEAELRWRPEAPGVEEDASSLCTEYRGLGVVLNPAIAPRVTSRAATFQYDWSHGGARRRRRATTATPFETFAQYEVRVALDGGPARSAWRRCSAFRAFASFAAQCSPIDVARTLTAWGDADAAKKVFRCVTDPHYLVQRYYRTRVLREALFEVDDPQLCARSSRRTAGAAPRSRRDRAPVVRPSRGRGPSPSRVAAARMGRGSEDRASPAVRESFVAAVPRHPRLYPAARCASAPRRSLRHPPPPRARALCSVFRASALTPPTAALRAARTADHFVLRSPASNGFHQRWCRRQIHPSPERRPRP